MPILTPRVVYLVTLHARVASLQRNAPPVQQTTAFNSRLVLLPQLAVLVRITPLPSILHAFVLLVVTPASSAPPKPNVLLASQGIYQEPPAYQPALLPIMETPLLRSAFFVQVSSAIAWSARNRPAPAVNRAIYTISSLLRMNIVCLHALTSYTTNPAAVCIASLHASNAVAQPLALVA